MVHMFFFHHQPASNNGYSHLKGGHKIFHVGVFLSVLLAAFLSVVNEENCCENAVYSVISGYPSMEHTAVPFCYVLDYLARGHINSIYLIIY